MNRSLGIIQLQVLVADVLQNLQISNVHGTLPSSRKKPQVFIRGPYRDIKGAIRFPTVLHATLEKSE
jgi:hypothetical protein